MLRNVIHFYAVLQLGSLLWLAQGKIVYRQNSIHTQNMQIFMWINFKLTRQRSSELKVCPMPCDSPIHSTTVVAIVDEADERKC